MENFLVKIFVFAIICIIGSSFGIRAFAQDECICDPDDPNFGYTSDGRPCICPPLKYKSIQEIIERIVNFIWYLGWAIFPLLILVGAFYIMTSGGRRDMVSKGKKMIVYAIIGLIIILFAKVIIAVIKSILGVTS